MGFRHDRASAGRSHEPLARGAHGAGPARTVLAGLVAVATLATGGLVASTAYAGGCIASMFVRQVRQCFSAVWADGFPRCRHRFPVM